MKTRAIVSWTTFCQPNSWLSLLLWRSSYPSNSSYLPKSQPAVCWFGAWLSLVCRRSCGESLEFAIWALEMYMGCNHNQCTLHDGKFHLRPATRAARHSGWWLVWRWLVQISHREQSSEVINKTSFDHPFSEGWWSNGTRCLSCAGPEISLSFACNKVLAEVSFQHGCSK